MIKRLSHICHFTIKKEKHTALKRLPWCAPAQMDVPASICLDASVCVCVLMCVWHVCLGVCECTSKEIVGYEHIAPFYFTLWSQLSSYFKGRISFPHHTPTGPVDGPSVLLHSLTTTHHTTWYFASSSIWSLRFCLNFTFVQAVCLSLFGTVGSFPSKGFERIGGTLLQTF